MKSAKPAFKMIKILILHKTPKRMKFSNFILRTVDTMLNKYVLAVLFLFIFRLPTLPRREKILVSG